MKTARESLRRSLTLSIFLLMKRSTVCALKGREFIALKKNSVTQGGVLKEYQQHQTKTLFHRLNGVKPVYDIAFSHFTTGKSYSFHTTIE